MKEKSVGMKSVIVIALCALLGLVSVGLANFSVAKAVSATAITITAPSATISGKVEFTLTKTLDSAETETDKPLEIFVDRNLVYKGAYFGKIELDTTSLANGVGRTVKAKYSTNVGVVENTTTVTIDNAVSGVDPVAVYTAQMLHDATPIYSGAITGSIQNTGGGGTLFNW